MEALQSDEPCFQMEYGEGKSHRKRNIWLVLIIFAMLSFVGAYISSTEEFFETKQGTISWRNSDDVPCNPSDLDPQVWQEVTKRKMKYYGRRRIFYNQNNGRYVAYDKGIQKPGELSQPSHWHVLNRGKHAKEGIKKDLRYLLPTPDGGWEPTSSYHFWANCQ